MTESPSQNKSEQRALRRLFPAASRSGKSYYFNPRCGLQERGPNNQGKRRKEKGKRKTGQVPFTLPFSFLLLPF
jgi:hypothetical protein